MAHIVDTDAGAAVEQVSAGLQGDGVLKLLGFYPRISNSSDIAINTSR